MSTKYTDPEKVPDEVLIQRLRELVNAISNGPEAVEREFTMRIPAELDRDADCVIEEAARRLEKP